MKFKSISIYPIILVMTARCTPFYYATNSQIVPLLRAKGESVTGFTGVLDHSRIGVEFNAAHAVSDHIALTANAAYSSIDESKGFLGCWTLFGPTDCYRVTHQIYNIGLGYFTKLRNENFLVELYSGAGLGKLEFEDVPAKLSASTKMSRYFIQPSISYYFLAREKVGLSFAFSTQIAQVNYAQIRGDFPQEIRNNSSLSLIQPALTVSLGPFSKLPMKVMIQYCHLYPLNSFRLSFEKENLSASAFFWIKSRAERKKNH